MTSIRSKVEQSKHHSIKRYSLDSNQECLVQTSSNKSDADSKVVHQVSSSDTPTGAERDHVSSHRIKHSCDPRYECTFDSLCDDAGLHSAVIGTTNEPQEGDSLLPSSYISDNTRKAQHDDSSIEYFQGQAACEPSISSNIMTSTHYSIQVNTLETRRNDSNKCEQFEIRWRNLTLKVDNEQWLARAKDRLFNRNESRDTSKTILNSISGSIRSGQLTAILGPSGSGKSSLLNCLFRNQTNGVTGSIQVGGNAPRKLKLCFIPQQDYLIEYLTVLEDLMFVSKLRNVGSCKNKTCKDGKHFSAIIDHRSNATRIAEQFGLVNCIDVKIGRLSGGQQKRLSIAREVMSNPDVLILDEPTTGLDSLSCLRTIRVLRNLVDSSFDLLGRSMSIVVVIHQPQQEIFNMFDKAYVLSRRGDSIYEDKPTSAVDTIKSCTNLSLPCPNYNVASFLLEIASDPMYETSLDLLIDEHKRKYSGRYASDEDTSLSSCVNSANVPLDTLIIDRNGANEVRIAFSPSFDTCGEPSVAQEFEQHNAVRSKSLGALATEQSLTSSSDSATKQTRSVPAPVSTSTKYFKSRELKRATVPSHPKCLKCYFNFVVILMHRSWLSIVRNPSFSRSRLVFHIAFPLLMAAVCGTKLGPPTGCPVVEGEVDLSSIKEKIANKLVAELQESARLTFENIGLYFIMCFGLGISIMTATSTVFPFTIRLIRKEYINGLYPSAPYLVAQTLAELPTEIFFPSLSIIIMYTLTGQTAGFMQWRMFVVVVVYILFSYTMHSHGLMFGAMLPNSPNIAVLTAQGSTLPYTLVSGFLVRASRMPEWLNKITMLSPYKLGLNGALAARYGFHLCPCSEDSIVNGTFPIADLSPQVRHVFDYYMESSNSTKSGSDFFEKLGKRLIDAQTYGLTIRSCDDVKPFPLHAYNVEDIDLYYSIIGMFLIILVTKLITFSLIRLHLGRGKFK
ncbi:ATP-binding cassette sub-family G member 1 [Fragariocoptes setiger]|uniref:ATP-binding cassette sub-family G member 1 n=1 Tax=Fragariocoptes setiger TaxID=1670756 RepID=A0ABQ7S9I4_9ACAR|nr:ATP-binding cassette sub-family G member 1 [Fragariocoptes setiger]